MLIVFGGLPGTGKSTIARALARALRATYLRVDVIEQAIRAARGTEDAVGPEGYVIAYAVAGSNLELGQIVVADSVNPLPVTREAWRGVAARASAPLLEIEIVCNDAAEHRLRVETRAADIPGASPPTWAAVTAREYAAWPEAHLVIDTARASVEEAVAIIVAAVDARRETPPCRTTASSAATADATRSATSNVPDTMPTP
jgi:predicted kinase